MNIKVQNNQALIDIALQGTGDVTRLLELSRLNNIGITQDLVPGAILVTPDAAVDKKNLQVFFNTQPNIPASDADGDVISVGGIGYWYISSPEPATTVQ